jgi:hypothetical protein
MPVLRYTLLCIMPKLALYHSKFSVTFSVDLRLGLREKLRLTICLRVKSNLDFTASQWRDKLCLNILFFQLTDLTKLYMYIYIYIYYKADVTECGKTHTQLGGKVRYTTSEYGKGFLTPGEKCR